MIVRERRLRRALAMVTDCCLRGWSREEVGERWPPLAGQVDHEVGTGAVIVFMKILLWGLISQRCPVSTIGNSYSAFTTF
jgi:hypothetical protein